MYPETLDSNRISLLQALVSLPVLSPFYLAGGTALSLQYGLRKSVDFDFFTENKFSPDIVFSDIRQSFPDTKMIYSDRDTCDMMIGKVQVSFFRYPYPLVSSLVTGDNQLNGLKMANVDDIAVMKLSAIGSRGSRKDFYDLFQIYHVVPDFHSERLVSAVYRKFGQEFDMTYMVMGLSYFENAEDETLPHLYIPADWGQIKRFFIAEQQKLFQMLQNRYAIGSST